MENLIQNLTSSSNRKERKFGDQWVDRASSRESYKNKISVLRGLAQSSTDLDLLPQCEVFKETPTLILKAGNESMISSENLEKMKQTFIKSRSVIFEKSGHDISSPDYPFYIKTMREFLDDWR